METSIEASLSLFGCKGKNYLGIGIRFWNYFFITCLFFEFSIKKRAHRMMNYQLEIATKAFFFHIIPKKIVTLASPKLLTFGKTQINLVILSLNRNFAPEI